MHAWLAIVLTECSDAVIDADPFGVLIYGDPYCLALSQQVRLLDALSRLAAADPYFRPEENAPVAINALCQSDMAPHLKMVLQNQTAPFGLKLLILDALGSAPPLPALQREIVAIISNPTTPFGLKAPAIRAVARLGSVAIKSVVKLYHNLGSSADEIRLRAYILSKFYTGNFSPKDVSDLYNTAAQCKEALLSGILWQISTSIPTHEIPIVLDAVSAGRVAKVKISNEQNRNEREHLIDRLVTRAIEEGAEGVSGRRLWAWLEMRTAIRGDHDNRQFDGIKLLLAERPDLAWATFEAAIDSYTTATLPWRFYRRLGQHFPYSLGTEPVHWLTNKLIGGVADAGKRQALYEMAPSWTYINPDGNISVFEALYDLANSTPDLQPTRNTLTANAIQGWQAEDKQRAAAELEKRTSARAKNLQQFSTDIDHIRTGTHLGWMIWAADVYFANFSDVDRTKSCRERLEDELGLENTVAVLDGLKALVRTRPLPTLQDLGIAESKNSYPKLWHAIMAGLDELWLETPSLSGFSDDALKVFVGIDLLMPTWSEQSSGTAKRDARAWKDHIFRRPELVKDTIFIFLMRVYERTDNMSPGYTNSSITRSFPSFVAKFAHTF